MIVDCPVHEVPLVPKEPAMHPETYSIKVFCPHPGCHHYDLAKAQALVEAGLATFWEDESAMGAIADTILPCPFCSENSPEMHFGGEGPPPSYSVQCGMCGARGPHGLGRGRGDHEGGRTSAIEQWNAAPRAPKEV